MNVSGECFSIKADHVFGKRSGLSEELAVGVKGKAGAVEDQAIVPADLIHHGDRHAVMPSNSGEHLAAKLTLAERERRGRDIQQDFAARANEVFDRIDAVQTAIPEVLVVPSVFTNREGAGGS